MATRIDFGKASFLMTGDLELDGDDALLAKHHGSPVLDVDVWQVSHHGSINGTKPELLDALTPTIALLGTGNSARHSTWSAWQYGHPRKEIIDLLEQRLTRARTPEDVSVGLHSKSFTDEHVDKAIYATGWNGNVVVTAWNDGRYEVVGDR